MESYQRSYPLLSVCGLNCGLCPRYHTDGSSKCPGCGGKDFFAKRPACGIISCSRRHGELEYCYLCEEYPCNKYDGVEQVDSFISHRNMLSDFAKAKQIGIEAYQAELNEKLELLEYLLANYNDGKHKSFFCLAVNLLELADSKEVVEQLSKEDNLGFSAKEKAALAAQLLQERADRRGVVLALRKKQK